MATTRLMPLHTGKGRTVGQAISAIIDYTENPQKTDGGRLITSWQCDSRIADAEFLFTKNQYIQKTGRVRGEDDVIAYHPVSYTHLWTQDNKIKSLKEFGCNLHNYNPYRDSDIPVFREEKANWF